MEGLPKQPSWAEKMAAHYKLKTEQKEFAYLSDEDLAEMTRQDEDELEAMGLCLTAIPGGVTIFPADWESDSEELAYG
jgi:hypothetical protein